MVSNDGYHPFFYCVATQCELYEAMTAYPERTILRRQLLSTRDALRPEERFKKSLAITNTLCQLPDFRERLAVFIYCSYRSEVETLKIMHRALAQKKRVSVPLTIPATKQLQARAISDPQMDLAPGYKGIPEPFTQTEKNLIEPMTLEVAIIPGVGFDHNGHRLGYGAGYYDRFLALEAPQALRIGLAYSCQVVPALPAEPHDVPMDILITETTLHSWPRSV